MIRERGRGRVAAVGEDDDSRQALTLKIVQHRADRGEDTVSDVETRLEVDRARLAETGGDGRILTRPGANEGQ